jgi:hypothetical protein
MKWMKERDLLIAQTMAFVESVTGKKPETEQRVETRSIVAQNLEARSIETSVSLLSVETSTTEAAAPTPDIAALLAMTNTAAALPKPVPVMRPDVRSDFQSEIKARVADFRAQQQRFTREREAYCSATMNKIHATLRGSEQPPRQGK